MSNPADTVGADVIRRFPVGSGAMIAREIGAVVHRIDGVVTGHEPPDLVCFGAWGCFAADLLVPVGGEEDDDQS